MYTEFIIYSVFSGKKSDLQRHYKELRWLRSESIPYKTCVGVYKGIEERSIMIPRAFGALVTSRAWHSKQESILVVNEESKAFLRFANGEVKRLGTWTRTTAEYNGDRTLVDKGFVYTVI